MAMIGFLLPVPQGPLVDAMYAAFQRGMAELGYVEGKNYATESRMTRSRYRKLRPIWFDLM